jgi:serralysin
LKESIPIGGQDLKTFIVGTNNKDKVTGTFEGEVLAGGVGRDVLKGRGGADGFQFNQPNEYGKKKADKIKDFDSDEGDSSLSIKTSWVSGKISN